MKKVISIICVMFSLLFVASTFVSASDGMSFGVSTGPVPDDWRFEGSISYVSGDANGDGFVNVKDATFIQKVIANILTIDNIDLKYAADVDESYSLTIKDVTLVQKHISGLESDNIGKNYNFSMSFSTDTGIHSVSSSVSTR